MEAFQSLMQTYALLLIANILISLALWRGTRSQPFFTLTLHWTIEVITFFLTGAVAGMEPIYRVTVPLLPAFLGMFTLALVLAQMLNLEMPVRKFIWIPFLAAGIMLTLNNFDTGPELLALPSSICTASGLYYVTYHAIRYRRKTMTIGQWMLTVLFMIYGIHLLDFPYFYVRFELLTIGFTIALIFHYMASIFVPAVIVEHLAKEKSKLETELKYKAQMEQSARMAALGEMAGGVALEMNNPLMTATLLMEQISKTIKEESPNHPVEKMALKSLATLNRIAVIVKGLLEFSQEEKSIERFPVDLNEVVQKTLELVQERVDSHDIKLKVEVPAGSTLVMGHSVQLSQVLVNLLNNSIDALDGMPEKQILLRLQRIGDHAEISVTDSGSGIPSELRDRVFDPFFTTKEIGKGTGLGLSISKGLIESHGGKIILDSDSKQTRFVIFLPLKSE